MAGQDDQLGRRALLKAAGAAGAVGWMAPTVLSLSTPAAAASNPGGGGNPAPPFGGSPTGQISGGGGGIALGSVVAAYPLFSQTPGAKAITVYSDDLQTVIRDFGTTANLFFPQSVEVDAAHRTIVSDAFQGINVFSDVGVFVTKFAYPGTNYPGLAADPTQGDLYYASVTNLAPNSGGPGVHVLRLSGSTLSSVRSFPTPGGSGGLDFGPDGHLYIGGVSTVAVYDVSNGALVRTVPVPGPQTAAVPSTSVDPWGRIFLTRVDGNQGNQTGKISVIDENGVPLTTVVISDQGVNYIPFFATVNDQGILYASCVGGPNVTPSSPRRIFIIT